MNIRGVTMTDTRDPEILYQQIIEEYEKKLRDVSKPIIITEGKTDWKHLKNALLEFQNKGMFKDLDIEFLEYENNMGDSELEVLLNKVSIFNDAHKIIGIFDNDEKVGQKYDKIEYKDFGNKVYGFCIPNPRNLPYGISIEFLYNDSDIKLESSDGKRLYLSDEYKEIFYNKLVPDTYEHVSSTSQDIQRKNKTEIDSLTGKVIRLGEEHKIDVSTNKVIYNMIKAIESEF